MDVLLIVLGVVWFLLNIMLFFKLWGTCNNIKRIADKFAPKPTDEEYWENWAKPEKKDVSTDQMPMH